jgi:uncharacterized membrane protein YfcA
MELLSFAEVAALGAVAFLGALVFGITGFGLGLVTIPLAIHVVPLGFALALYSISDLGCTLRVGMENPKNAVRAEWIRLVPMILLGTALGATLLVRLPRPAAMLLLGAFVVGFALYSLFPRPATRTISSAWAWPAGLLGGITSTLFGAGGPPYAIYLSQRGLDKQAFRATMAFATTASISLRVAAFVLTGALLEPAVWVAALAAVPGALAGIELSRRIFIRMSRETLMRAVALMLLASGASLIYRAV